MEVLILTLALCLVYSDGTQLIEEIKAKRRKGKLQRHSTLQDIPSQELESSLSNSRNVVRTQYHHDFQRLGDRYATGDKIAKDSLKDIITELQNQLITSLKVAWQQEVYVDFYMLRKVSDVYRDKAIVTLMQLHQRILTLTPIRNLHPQITTSNLPITDISPGSLSPGRPNRLWSSPSSPSPRETSPARIPTPPTSIEPDVARSDILPPIPPPKSEHRDPNLVGEALLVPRPLRPSFAKASTLESPQGKGLRRPISYETLLVDDLLIFDSPVSDRGYTAETISADWSPWMKPRSPSSNYSKHGSHSSVDSRRLTMSTSDSRETTLTSETSISNVSRTSSKSMEVRGCLPCQENQFAGFCKGAWRLQIGDKKKAMTERQRPGGMFNKNAYWKCSKCEFEGRVGTDSKGKKSFDTRVLSADGILYRWEFLFKSHVHVGEKGSGGVNPLTSTFGCMFCCAQGKGTPQFGGVQSLMKHLQDHRDRLPTGEVLYRINCVIGRAAEVGEEYDINLPSRVI